MGDASHSFEAYYKRATSPLAVLCLLSEKTMYGYEISHAMSERSGGRFTIAVLYPVLYRLVDQGYIREADTEVVNRRARSYYAITDEGRAYLERSLREYDEMHRAFGQILGRE